MCGRYTLSAGHEALAREFLAEFAEEMKASWNSRYNISPGTGIVAIQEDRDKGGRKADVFHWGLVPSWAKDPDIGYKLINARAETIAQKPSFRDAFRYRRCLVPASGFYEWDRTKSPRQPHYFHPAESSIMAMAGIWEHWLHPCGSEILSISLITTAANKLMEPIHHRMPLILPRESWAEWLSTDNVKPSIETYLDKAEPDNYLQCHPVSTRVNKASEEGEDLIHVQDSEEQTGGQLDLF
jgi:putative SOS response-associated peptidase YedK